MLRDGGEVALLALGAGVEIALDAADLLAAQGIRASVVNARFCKPLDAQTLLSVARSSQAVVTVEDGIAQGGFGSAVLELLSEHGVLVPTALIGLPDHFIEHGPVPLLRELAGLTAEEVARKAISLRGLRPSIPAYANGKPPLRDKQPVGVGT